MICVDAYLVDWLDLLIRWLHVDRGDRLDRDVVLLRRARQPPAAAAQDRATPSEGVGGESWEIHGGGFYRIQKFRVAPRDASRAAALVQVGGVHDLAVAASRCSSSSTTSTRTRTSSTRASRDLEHGDGDRDQHRRCSRSAWLVYDGLCRAARRPRARCSRSLLVAFVDARRVRRRASSSAPRARTDPGRRDARDDHGRQRLLRDHPGPLGARPREAGRPRARPGARDARASSARCTTTT